MEKKPIHGNGRFQRFINGKGFYGILAACLLATGGIAVATFGEALFVSDKTVSDTSEDTRQVQQEVSGIPHDTTTTTSATEKTTTTTVAVETVAADLYIFPIGNTVQREYSPKEPQFSITMGDWRIHRGTDFQADESGEVKAMADGSVTAIETDPLWGESLTIDHGDGVESKYYGVHATVEVGQSVQVGNTVGTLSPIPCEEMQGSHLHLEVLVDGETVNPVEAIGRETRLASEKSEN